MNDVSSSPKVAPNPAYKQEIIKIPGTMLYIRIDTGPDLEEAQLCFDDGDADTNALGKFWGVANARLYEAIMAESRRSPSPAGVTEAAVEAAWLAFDNSCPSEHWKAKERVRDALLAAIPLLSPSMGWGIKKLEWEDKGNGLFKAATPFGYAYFVNTRTHMWIGLEDDWAVAENLFAAAQADFEARVRFALLPPANGEGR